MKDVLEVLMKIVSVFTLPFFIVGYAIYGIRVWSYNVVHESALRGSWKFAVPKK